MDGQKGGHRRGFFKHLKKITETSGPRNFKDIQNLITPTITSEENNELIAILDSTEIIEATIQLGSLKSPSPDGYPAIFYQHMWESVGFDIINIVQEFFRSKSSLQKIHKTFIVFAPQKKKVIL